MKVEVSTIVDKGAWISEMALWSYWLHVGKMEVAHQHACNSSSLNWKNSATPSLTKNLTEGGDNVEGCVDPRFGQVCLSWARDTLI